MLLPRHVVVAATAPQVFTANMRNITLYLIALCLAATLTGCGQARTAAPADGSGQELLATISIDEFPDGIGRGYAVAYASTVDTGATGVEAGDPAANFRLELEDGGTLSLHDLQGRPVMLNFWATWCGPCRIEMPEIVKQYESSDDLIVLAINVREERELVQAFSEQFAMSMPVVMDREGEIQDLYAVRAMPTSLFIDRNGVIVARFAGLITPDRLQGFLRLIL